MKRIYAAAGAAVLMVCLLAGWWFFSHRSQPAPSTAATPVYAYADLEHVVMSHPRYSEYHHLELEYNAMVAQYQFEQWNYSQKAAAEGTSVQNFAAADAAGTAALDQELQAKVALKENELNNRLKQRYDSLVQEKKKTTPVISQADTLKIVNLQLKLKTLSLSKEERAATEEQLQTLLKGSQADVQVTNRTADEIAALMAPDKAQAKKELVQEKKKTTPVISQADTLKIVNLQLKLKTLSLSKEERAATEEQLQTLLKGSQADVQVTNRTADEIAALMAPDKAQAKKELDDYAQQVKKDLEGRKADSQQVFQQQLGVLQDRPEPAVWNKEWKDKLDAKEKEMKDVKDAIMADIRDKAADVAQEQGFEMIFANYEGIGTATDVTDDIIAKLA